MTLESHRSPSHNPGPQETPAGSRWRPLIAALLVLGAVLVYRALRPTPALPVAQPAPTHQAGPLLRLEISADGSPRAGIEVALLGPKCQQRLTTDDQGVAEVESCPAGSVTATIESAGFVREQRFIQLKEHGTTEYVDLQPTGPLQGRVTDDEGSPLTAVTLVARLQGMEGAGYTPPPWTVLSAQDGSFVFETLPAGRVVLEVKGDTDHETLSLPEIDAPAESLAIVLRRTAAISGKVHAADAQPVAQASVTLAGSGVWPARTTQTNAAGEFVFGGLPEGVYEVRAQYQADVSLPLEGIQLQAGARVHYELTLAPGAVLSGTVRAAVTGRALAGAVLEVVEETLSGAAQRMAAAQDGAFQIVGLRNIPHRVTIRLAGYVTQQRWLKPGAAVNIELLRAAAISGKVEDADGHPVGHADLEVSGRSITGAAVHMSGPVQEAPALDPTTTVLAATAADNLGVTAGSVPRVPVLGLPGAPTGPLGGLGFQSDESGQFHVDGLPPGQVTITARKPRAGVGHSGPLTLRAGATLDDVVITLPRGYPLRGRVLDAHDAVVPHVRVDLESAGDPARSITTDSDGSFVFEATRGDCTLWARPLGAPAVKLSGAAHVLTQQDLVLKLEGGRERLTGRVLDAHGQPLDAASLRLEVVQSHGYAPVLLTEPDGTFEFNALPAPPYKLYVDHAEHMPVRALPVTQTRDPVIVRMELGATLSGVVSDGEKAAAISGAEVTYRGPSATRTLRTGRDGRFEFQHVSQGAYEVVVNAERYLAELRSGQLDSGVSLRIALTAAASVSGDVVDALGRTVWNAQVAAGSPPDWEHATRSDHAGHFQLRGLPPGEHLLHARYGDDEAVSTTPERVVAGSDTRGTVLRLTRTVDDTALQTAETASDTQSARPQALAFARRAGGIVVERVAPGSAGARAGLVPGDVLLTVDGEPVRSAAQARGMLSPLAGRSSVRLDVRRAGEIQHLQYSALGH